MPESWIKIYRKFEEWEWFQSAEMVQLFICLLINASPLPKRWKGMIIERGQLMTSYESLHNKTGLSIRTLRTCLGRLEEKGEIIREATNKFSIITICNYDCYQDGDFESDKQTTSNGQTNDTHQPKPKKTKEEIKADTERRMKKFYTSLIPFVQTYGKQMVREFYDFWSETNKSGSKMRWEQQTTWVLEKRLAYWSRNDKSYKSKSNGIDRTNNSTREERATGAANLVARLIADNKPVDE